MSKRKAVATKDGTKPLETAQQDPKSGRFLAGNSGFGGRPKGARSKLTTEFFVDFYTAWQEHGPEALRKVARDNPKDFVRAAAMLMPKEFEIKTPMDDMNDGELADLIAAVQSLLAGGGRPLLVEGLTLTPAGGERPASKPH